MNENNIERLAKQVSNVTTLRNIGILESVANGLGANGGDDEDYYDQINLLTNDQIIGYYSKSEQGNKDIFYDIIEKFNILNKK